MNAEVVVVVAVSRTLKSRCGIAKSLMICDRAADNVVTDESLEILSHCRRDGHLLLCLRIIETSF